MKTKKFKKSLRYKINLDKHKYDRSNKKLEDKITFKESRLKND